MPKRDIQDHEKWMLRVSPEYLIEWGNKKRQEQEQKRADHPVQKNHYINKRRRYIEYIEWKQKVRQEAYRVKLMPPVSGFWIKFFIPMPKSWSKKKRNQLCFTPNQTHPDVSNMVKAAEDALFQQDMIIWDYRASKFWYDGPGHIEITIGALPEAVGYTKFKIGDELA